MLRASDQTGEATALVPWWSFGKTLLATAALRLVAEGRLVLDDRLERLLQHRAGLADYGMLPDYHAAVARNDPPWPPAEIRARVAGFAVQGWRYSNVGYTDLRDLIETATGADLATRLRQLVDIRLATTPADLAACAWGNPAGYHPGWVYHGLLLGTPRAAADFLHRLIIGDILPPDLLARMTTPFPLGETFPHRPWQTTGYGLGLMIGEMAGAGLAIGHSGGGPGSVAAVYHFPAHASTCAAFAQGDDVGAVEWEVARAMQQAVAP